MQKLRSFVRLPFSTALIGSALVGSALVASGGDVLWTGGAGTRLWSDPANWQDGVLPQAGDTVTLNDGTEEAPVVADGSVQADLTSLTVADAAGTRGALRVEPESRLLLTNGLHIGVSGRGAFELAGGTLITGKPMTVGQTAGSEGLFTLSGGIFYLSNSVAVATAGAGTFTQTGGNIIVQCEAGQTRMMEMAIEPDSTATLDLSGGTISSSAAFHLYAGRYGHADVRVSGDASASFSRTLNAAEQPGSTCSILVTNQAAFKFATESFIGIRGTATCDFHADVTLNRGFVLGQHETGIGIMRAGPITITCNNADSKSIPGTAIGKRGHGELYLDGTTITLFKRGIRVREEEPGFGVLRGWGTIQTSGKSGDAASRILINNGLIIADGGGEARDLTFNSGFTAVTNTLDNASTNGWYAVRGARLILPPLTVPAGTAAINWGEAAGDAVPDLVHSARLTFADAASGGTVQGMLLATDAATLPETLPREGLAAVWSFTANDALALEAIEVCADPAQTRGLSLTLRRHTPATDTWDYLPILAEGNGRIAAATDSFGLFALYATHARTILLVR